MELKICHELRPCIFIKTGEHLLFHGWKNEDIALCEKEDGTIIALLHNMIKFIDNKHSEYSFFEKRR